MTTKLPTIIYKDEKSYELLLVFTNLGTAEVPNYCWCCKYVHMIDNDSERKKPRTIGDVLDLEGTEQKTLGDLETKILEQIKDYIV